MEVLGSKDNVDYADLNKFSVISNCLKESLRLSPPGALLAIETTEDFIIPDDKHSKICSNSSSAGPICSRNRQTGKIIPSGTKTYISLYAMQRHPLLWSNADQFLPDRWAAKTEETITPSAFTPFSMGPRNCIGQVFAQMETKIILSRFLRAFDYECVEEEHPDEIDEVFLLHLRRGLPVKVKESV